MQSRYTKKIIAWSLVIAAPLGLYLAQSSLASNAATTSLIDKDFESSLHKFISHRFYNRIKASDEQRQKLDAISTSTMETTRPEREELRHKLLDLSDLMISEQTSDEQIVEKMHELRTLHEKIMDQRLESLLKARKVLSQEQRQKIHDRFYEAITGGIVLPRRIALLIDQ